MTLPPSKSEHATEQALKAQNPKLERVVAAFEGQIAANEPMTDPALLYIRSLKSPASRRQALHVLIKLLADYPWEPSETSQWAQLDAHKVDQLLSFYLAGGAERKPLTPATVNLRLSIIKGIAREAYRANLIDRKTLDAIADLKRVTADGSDHQATRPIVHREEVTSLLEELERLAWQVDASPIHRRDAALIAVMFGGGPRRAEVAAMSLGDIVNDGEHQGIQVMGKGRRRRLITLPPRSWSLLQAWIFFMQTERTIAGYPPAEKADPIFARITKGGRIQFDEGISGSAIYHRVKTLLDKHLDKKGTPHALRRGILTHLLNEGHDLSTVQSYAGHASPSTTVLYDMSAEERKRTAAKRLMF